MSLSLSYEIARGGLSTNSKSTNVVTRNLSNVDNASATRKSLGIGWAAPGARSYGVTAAVDSRLFEVMLEARAASSEASAIATALTKLSNTVGDPELETSVAAQLGKLQAALQSAASSPTDEMAATTAVHAAKDVVRAITDAARAIEAARTTAATQLTESVGRLNGLLADFRTVNDIVVNGAANGKDVTDEVDERSRLLGEIASLIDVRVLERSGSDIVIFASNGSTLFEAVPRQVVLDGSASVSPGQPGPALVVDGVRYAGVGVTKVGGSIGGLLQVRDDIALTYARQLDELARGLIHAFRETAQSTSGASDLAGLFTHPGGPALPSAPGVVDGLAAQLSVNPNVDPGAGGVASRLRDGGISDPLDPNYLYNVARGTGYSERLRELSLVLSQPQSFDPSAGLSTSSSVIGFAQDSAGWVERIRSSKVDASEDKTILATRAATNWQGRVGISLDEELTDLMTLERSYKALSRLITSVTAMFDSVLAATR